MTVVCPDPSCDCWPLRKERWAIASRVVQENAKQTTSRPDRMKREISLPRLSMRCGAARSGFCISGRLLSMAHSGSYPGSKVDPGSCSRLKNSNAAYTRSASHRIARASFEKWDESSPVHEEQYLRSHCAGGAFRPGKRQTDDRCAR